ncbi:hypothetical protein ACFX15_026824 [Malus domestica]
MPKALFGHEGWYLGTLSSISDNAKSSTSTTKLIYTYSIQGFSVVLTLYELEALKESHGFVSFALLSLSNSTLPTLPSSLASLLLPVPDML